MYEIMLYIHSYLRWILLALIVIVFIKSLNGYLRNSPFSKLDNIFGIALIAATHTQLLIGLILYFALSPISSAGMMNFGMAVKNDALRYWTLEHLVAMIVFVFFVQLGRSLSKRTQDAKQKHKKQALFLAIALVVLMANLPWPQRKEGIARPFFMSFPSASTQR